MPVAGRTGPEHLRRHALTIRSYSHNGIAPAVWPRRKGGKGANAICPTRSGAWAVTAAWSITALILVRLHLATQRAAQSPGKPPGLLTVGRSCHREATQGLACPPRPFGGGRGRDRSPGARHVPGPGPAGPQMAAHGTLSCPHSPRVLREKHRRYREPRNRLIDLRGFGSMPAKTSAVHFWTLCPNASVRRCLPS